MTEPYTFVAACDLVRMKDADTFSLVVHVPGEVDVPMLGLSTTMTFPVPMVLRLEGVNAPEKNTAAGQVAIEFVKEWFNQNPTLYLFTNGKLDSFGRWLGDLRPDQYADVGLAYTLLVTDHAEVYTRHGSW